MDKSDTLIAKRVLTPDDLAEELGISIHSIYQKTSKKNRQNTNLQLPKFFYIGKLIRFYREDVIDWLESRPKIDPNKD